MNDISKLNIVCKKYSGFKCSYGFTNVFLKTCIAEYYYICTTILSARWLWEGKNLDISMTIFCISGLFCYGTMMMISFEMLYLKFICTFAEVGSVTDIVWCLYCVLYNRCMIILYPSNHLYVTTFLTRDSYMTNISHFFLLHLKHHSFSPIFWRRYQNCYIKFLSWISSLE